MASLRITSFMSLVFLSFSCSYADESITNTQPLTTWETMFSPNRIYALGFFTTATTTPSSSFYLGIWLSNDTQRQAVWVANRENPIHSSSPSLKISNSGNLIISSNGITDIRITNATGTSTNTSAKLLDNGNLVLLEEVNGDSIEGRILWQSFDHPTDTLLPGVKLRFESDEDGKYFIYTINQTAGGDNCIYKWVMTSSGQISRDQWHTVGSSSFWSKVEKMNSPCNGTFEDDGCRRRAWPNCSDKNENIFSKEKMTINFNMYDINSSIALSDCEFTCRSSCSCIAYTTKNEDGTGCLFRYDNGREIPYLPPYTGDFFIRVLPPTAKKPGRKTWKSWIISQHRAHRKEKGGRREQPVLELHTNKSAGAKFK
ncbi:hypothetical protein MRB53_030856 [Persea americana]|uniref:Uncharacterized protein n=1 Tax=Persea americana TaxID=3435 RepID=A0ACC2KMS5_PERAE|nr:hypothetical protein MRB53_030856 [Persea americana]